MREYLLLTPVQALAGFAVWVGSVLAAIGIGWWLRRAEEGDDPDATVELPPPSSRGRRRPPNTGAVHYHRSCRPSDDPTVVLHRGVQS